MRFGLEYVGPILSTESVDRQDDAKRYLKPCLFADEGAGGGGGDPGADGGGGSTYDAEGDVLRLRARKAMVLMTTLATKPWRTSKPC
ncbi:unnamed protein product [Ectocarpus sp. CCAP 1310/34]|nr:unnamed protein product [Ectocarpus sp. CCAP 1310/34]